MPTADRETYREQSLAKALELQAKIYDRQLADHEQRLKENAAQIARILWIAAGISFALTTLFALLTLLIAALTLYLSFKPH